MNNYAQIIKGDGCFHKNLFFLYKIIPNRKDFGSYSFICNQNAEQILFQNIQAVAIIKKLLYTYQCYYCWKFGHCEPSWLERIPGDRQDAGRIIPAYQALCYFGESPNLTVARLCGRSILTIDCRFLCTEIIKEILKEILKEE